VSIPFAGAGRQYRDTCMFVKICGITSEDDALLAVAMGADAVGFVFAPSPRQVPAQQVYDITRRLPPEIMTVGVFRDEHPRRVVDIVHRSGVKGAQLHGNESAEVVGEVAKAVRFLVKAYPAGSPMIAASAALATDTILIDGPSPGSGHLFDWSLVGEIPEGMRMILAGGLTAENVADAVQTVMPWGVDVATGVESAPGKKDPLKVKRFIERARAAAPVPYLADAELPYDWSDE
jgi:phosphoribosylanthranilate isomerase